MASRTYQNFDLLIEAEEAGTFRALVMGCPSGDNPTARFRLPFEPTQLENLLLRLDPGRSGTRRATTDPRVEAAMAFGGPLFESVFSESLMLAWSRSQDLTREQGDGLRLRLRLTDAPSIAGLPWELLYDKRSNSYIAQSERTPVVRYLEVPQPPRPLPVDGALKILVVISSPTDLPELDVEAEWQRVHDALGAKVDQGTVQIDRLPKATIGALSAWLRTHDVHILHFIGHGDYDEKVQDGVVYFCDRYERAVKVAPGVLGPYLRDHDPLRLVLLNACQSARVDAVDPFSGMAQGLVQQDCTAVVAMQFPISDGAAVAFTAEFYGCLADGFPVDQAATSARKALLADFSSEWATPVLFLRSQDGRVFANITAVPVPAPVVEAAPEPTPEPTPEPDAEPTPEPETDPEPETEPEPEPPEPVGSRTPAAPDDALIPVYRQQPQPFSAPPPATWGAPAAPAPRKRSKVKIVVLSVIAGLIACFTLAAVLIEENGGGALPPADGHGVDPPVVVGRSTVTGPAITAAHLTTGLTINGDESDWPKGTALVDSNALIFGAKQTVQARWALAWDDDHLYAIVDVTDPTRTQTHAGDTSQLFRGDGVSFELGTAEPERGNTALEQGDLHVLLGPENVTNGKVLSAVNVGSGTAFGKGTSTIQGLDAATVDTDHGYVIEAAIPWSTLGVTGIEPGVALAMNLNVSDAVTDGAHKGDLLDMVSNNPARTGNGADLRSHWGTLTLAR